MTEQVCAGKYLDNENDNEKRLHFNNRIFRPTTIGRPQRMRFKLLTKLLTNGYKIYRDSRRVSYVKSGDSLCDVKRTILAYRLAGVYFLVCLDLDPRL